MGPVRIHTGPIRITERTITERKEKA
jgi:hypothetical protein